MTIEPCERTLVANRLRFRALEWEGAGASALFVHATSFCADGWRPVVEAASAAVGGARSEAQPGEIHQSESRWLRALAIDQRGHGGSDAPVDPAAYQWTRLAEDVAALAAALAVEDEAAPRVVGIGHSSGATALLAAAGMHPQRFAALIAVEPVLFEKPARGDADSFAGSSFLATAARRRRDRFASFAEARERLRARPPYAGFAPAAFDAVLHGILASDGEGVMLRCTGEREACCYEGAAALDLWPLAASIRAPLLLVLGEHGAVAPALRDRLVATLPSVRGVTIPGATHFAALERPSEVGAAIGNFLADFR
jgi:pimeloyl-ACP methyl ester carboxylesterase